MKVIAKVDHKRVLCEVSVEEIALLNGFNSPYDPNCKIHQLIEVDSECNLQKMVEISKFVRTLRKSILLDAKQKLLEGIKNIDNASDEITKLELFDILTNNEPK
jgi:hypothetical protein